MRSSPRVLASGWCRSSSTTTGSVKWAAIAMAGEMWVTRFRSFEFLEGDSGCGLDRRAVNRAVDDFGAGEAGVCHRILREHQADVLALAQRLDRDGHL
jgi:hypothetical protein